MKKQKYILFLSLKLLVAFSAAAYIIREAFRNKFFFESGKPVLQIFSDPEKGLLVFLVFVLMLLNWGTESMKWKILVKKIEKTGFLRSFMATLSGVTVSVFTPNRVGEFLGKIFFMEKGDKVQGSLIAVLGSMSQLLVTLIAGSVSLLFFIAAYQNQVFINEYIFSLLVFLVILILAFSLILFFSAPTLTLILNKIPILAPYKKYSDVFSFYSAPELLVILLLSALRYLIFSLQFYFLLLVFGVDFRPEDALVLIPMVFFTVTAVPTITPGEIGVREFFALQFIGTVSQNSGGIILSAFSLWIVNLAIPALTGIIFILGKKWNPEVK